MMSPLSKGALLGVAAGIAGIVMSNTPFGLNLEENLGLEILFRLRGPRRPLQEVVVVSIDKESADYLDQDADVTNWPRSLHAGLTERLARKGAAVIAFDVFFEEYADLEDDIAFAEAMRKANNVVVGERLQSERVVVTDEGGATGAGSRSRDDFTRFLSSKVPQSPHRLIRKNYIIRIYRRVRSDPDKIWGILEDVESGVKYRFTSFGGLKKILAATDGRMPRKKKERLPPKRRT